MQTVPYQLCPKCKGHKTLQTASLSTSSAVIEVTCDICHGAGIIPQHMLDGDFEEEEAMIDSVIVDSDRRTELKEFCRKKFGRVYQSHLEIIDGFLQIASVWALDDYRIFRRTFAEMMENAMPFDYKVQENLIITKFQHGL